MRFKLLKRRLTISAPTMAIRSRLPWPLRWVMAAFVFGVCAAVALWTFEQGKNIAGIDANSREELISLRAEVTELRQAKDQAQSVANTSGSLLAVEKASQEKLISQIKQLEQENKTLRDDLTFFERLTPTKGSSSVGIRGLHVEAVSPTQIKWQVLIIQPAKNATELRGKMDISFTGFTGSKAWSANLPSGGVDFSVKQYARLEGTLEVPAQTIVKNATAKITSSGQVRAVQSVKL